MQSLRMTHLALMGILAVLALITDGNRSIWADICTELGQQDDPGCPIQPPGKTMQCAPRENCWFVWNEHCANGTSWSCSTALTVPCCVEDPSLTVHIDIKPGDFPNVINPRSDEELVVALLTSPPFYATIHVDPSTLRFGATGTEATPVQLAFVDVDGDGNPDMVLHFNTQETGLTCDSTFGVLTGQTIRGQQLMGIDAIQTVGCEERHE